ncbi:MULTISPECIES: hypothetical protein [Sorangium]|uniref:Uncharacterized protein n=1 Tax=Sorangium cellulosum TaxID=56 RepID=A0A4P2QUA7_SORCE|nr:MULTISPECIES: hypothetical protein [Sorangium]AUX33930.1 uncharacterized protein SOCE836_060970 [Sorangium cellulosum]WCQ93239.1 hypothetical protein NQZ70_05987 [Sorangium sp. Soce836]
MPPTRLLRSTEIPQADNLANVRRVLEALAGGASAKDEIAQQTGISVRHVGYALAAARVLGWLGDDDVSITPAGRGLLAVPPGTADERAQLRRAIFACDVVKEVAPDLFEPAAPTVVALARRLYRSTAGIAKETARRRAQTLLAWRSQVLEQQLPLFPRRPRKRRAAATAGASVEAAPFAGDAAAPAASAETAPFAGDEAAPAPGEATSLPVAPGESDAPAADRPAQARRAPGRSRR